MELLLKQFEELKLQYLYSDDLPAIPALTTSKQRNIVLLSPSEPLADQFLVIAVSNAWVKLDKYYNLTDRSVAYMAAVVLNPAYKWKYFEKHWALKPEWLTEAKQAFQELWEQYKNNYFVSIPPPIVEAGLYRP